MVAVAYDRDCGGVTADDWQLVQTDFVDVPPGGDTSIRCVVQPPPDMLATHVCVEVGLVKSPSAASAEPEMPTIVVCNVDVEPYRKPQSASADRFPAAVSDGDTGAGGRDEDVLDRISQDLDYLLNRKCAADPPAAQVGGTAGQADRGNAPPPPPPPQSGNKHPQSHNRPGNSAET